MSYYYNYYLGYKKDGILYPMGPFSRKGKLECLLWKSRSYASDLHEDFLLADEKEVSDELYETLLNDSAIEECKKANIPYTEEEIETLANYYGGDKKNVPAKELKTYREALIEKNDQIRYLPLDKLPEGSIVKEGYVRYSEIERADEDGIYDVISPHEYAERLKTAIALGDIPKVDDEGNPFPRLSEYVYHKWIETDSREYESYLLRMMAENFRDYEVQEDEIVIIETEG